MARSHPLSRQFAPIPHGGAPNHNPMRKQHNSANNAAKSNQTSLGRARGKRPRKRKTKKAKRHGTHQSENAGAVRMITAAAAPGRRQPQAPPPAL